MNSTKEDSSKGGYPKAHWDSPAKRSPAGNTPGKGGQKWPDGIDVLLMLMPWDDTCCAHTEAWGSKLPLKSCFPGYSDFPSLWKDTAGANLHWALPMYQALYQVSKVPAIQQSQLQMLPKSYLPQDLCMCHSLCLSLIPHMHSSALPAHLHTLPSQSIWWAIRISQGPWLMVQEGDQGTILRLKTTLEWTCRSECLPPKGDHSYSSLTFIIK